ncbi:hypothetical protein LTR27_007408 [Elasticomyces elasticus]|nr:hypothetical protein LTR27_007408 [Elasticomyces elasticus]
MISLFPSSNLDTMQLCQGKEGKNISHGSPVVSGPSIRKAKAEAEPRKPSKPKSSKRKASEPLASERPSSKAKASEPLSSVPSSSETPSSGEVPTSSEAPSSSEAPASIEAPAGGEIPSGGEAPASNEAPATNEEPANNEAPSGDEVPASSEAPASIEAPVTPLREVPPGLIRTPASRISKTWASRTNNYPRPIGLTNPKYLCYRRALLQCLLNAPVFCNYLEEIHTVCEKVASKCVACALKALASKYWTNRPGNFPETAVKVLDKAITHCCTEGDPFYKYRSSRRQGDPLEFWQFLRGQLQDNELVDSRTSTSLDNLDNTKGSESGDGPEGLNYRIEDLVVMRFTQRTTCSVCDLQKDSDAYLKEDEISVTMTDEAKKYNGLDLLGCFAEHLRDEVEVGCDGCVAKLSLPASELGNSTKSQERWIVQAQDLLVMQIMRAGTYNKKYKTMNKLTADVPFDEELDLSAFTHDGTELRYRLYGVVAHRGPHASKGHYIAGVRDHGGKKFTRVDDDVIGRRYRGSFQEMKKPRNEDGDFTPGVLVWQRIE